MSDPRPPTPTTERLGVAQWAVEVVRGLTIQNILTLGLLLCVAVPAYFAWRFLHDDEFRHEFTSTSKYIDLQVPCLVAQGNISGQGERVTVAVAYELVGRMEHMIAFRAPGLLSHQEVATVCSQVHDHANLMKAAIEARDEKAAEGR